MEDIVATLRVETRRVAVRSTVWLGLWAYETHWKCKCEGHWLATSGRRFPLNAVDGTQHDSIKIGTARLDHARSFDLARRIQRDFNAHFALDPSMSEVARIVETRDESGHAANRLGWRVYNVGRPIPALIGGISDVITLGDEVRTTHRARTLRSRASCHGCNGAENK